MGDEVIKIATGTAFAIIQAMSIAVFAGAIKMYVDVRVLKRDMDEAFKKIRWLEKDERDQDV